MVNRQIFQPIDPETKRDFRGLTANDQRGLFAYLLSVEARAGMSYHTATKYRRLAHELGITVDADGLVPSVERSTFMVGLDYHRGTQELVAA